MNSTHICFDAESKNATLIKQKGLPVLCEHWKGLSESEQDACNVFNANPQKTIPVNVNVDVEYSALINTVQTKYNFMSKREAVHVICNAFRGISETTETAENTWIEPSIEVIRSTPEEAKQTSKRIAMLKEALDLKAEADHKHTLEVQKRALATARPTPQSLKVTDWGVGHIGIDTSVKIQSKDHILDANGFYGNLDWTPEQIAQMEKSIPCKGVETAEEFYENWEPPTWWHDIFK